jgi:hypothetical protein
MRETGHEAHAGSDRAGLKQTGAGQDPTGMDKRFPVALLLYVVLAALVWFTMDAGKVLVMGKPVEIRLLPLIVIGGLALRTVLARSAERIRRSGSEGGNSTP